MRAILALPLLALASPALAQSTAVTEDAPRMTGEIVSPDGEALGSVSVFETESGIIRVNVQATGMEPGPHGVHLHETGTCDGDFSSAGGHIAGDAEHGLVAGGPHPGDLPNAIVEEDGVLSMEAFAVAALTPDMLTDEDGAALIVHSGPDDYMSQPSGESGDRVACAVLSDEPVSDVVPTEDADGDAPDGDAQSGN